MAEDAAWAEIIVSSLSSATVELLLAELPMFAHVMPSLAGTPDAHCFDPDHRFTRAQEIQGGFQRCIELLDSGSDEAFAPNRRARRWFFGPSERPSALDDWLHARATARSV